MSFTTITSEGNLIPADLLEQITQGEADGQRPQDFGLDKSRRLTDEIATAWSDARAYWELFQRRLETLTRQGRLDESDPATSLTREAWVIPLLEALGYELTTMRGAAVVHSRTYFISHRAGADEHGPPIQIQGIRADLATRPPTGRPRISPHALVQEYLNATDHLWGLVTNGVRLRLLRDSSRTTRPTYLEFDLQAMLEGEKFSEFAILYRLLHRSRLPQSMDDAPNCFLEQYHQQALAAGGRVRDGLRDGVEVALKTLGNGLLHHPANSALREHVTSEKVTALDFYRQLLRLVYRLLFLMVAEERSLIGGGGKGPNIYKDYYGITRLRRMAERPSTGTTRYGDLWLGMQATFRLLEDDSGASTIGLKALDGDLFGPDAIADFEQTQMFNNVLLRAIRALSLYRDPQSKALRRVNYAALDIEELGSVYESLLDYRPVIVQPTSPHQTRPDFDMVSGTERKTTGSYYTRPELVQELIKSALEPVLATRLREAGSDSAEQQEAILSMKVCDPACGSGHFLLAAARRLARELAQIRSGENQPDPDLFRKAVREVIARCIYGVDANPLAVDLCKVALWLESLNEAMPLSFLDAHIRWGNSLIGTRRDLIDAGVPSEAYKPVIGDDKSLASDFRKRNTGELDQLRVDATQHELFDTTPDQFDYDKLSSAARRLDVMPDTDVRLVREKEASYRQLRQDSLDPVTLHHLWTAAFFVPLDQDHRVFVPTTTTIRTFEQRPAAVHAGLVGRAAALAQELGFFHWELEFPEVFGADEQHQRGFDVVLGNPPWERIKLQEQEHWVDIPEIARAANKATRERLIKEWRNGDETQQARVKRFDQAKHRAEAASRFVRASGRFPLTAVGDVNTYALFAEHARDLLAPTGRAGIIVPTGIATDDTTKRFFGRINTDKQLISLYDFENREAIFPGVHRSYKFSLLTLGVTSQPTHFVFFATNIKQLDDEQRRFTLSAEELALLNPNTNTCPVFRTRADANLTKKIYDNAPILLRIDEDNDEIINPWEISFLRMFDMANDSHLFQNDPDEGLLPLYEAKLLHQFTHRWATYEGGSSRDSTTAELADPHYTITPRYWISVGEVAERLKDRWDRQWLLGFRDIARSTDERTALFSVLPKYAVNHKTPLLFLNNAQTNHTACFLATINSLTLDFVVRQKVGGTSLSFFIVNQLPVLPPERFDEDDIAFIVPRVLELVYTAWNLSAFAVDVWEEADAELREALRRRHAACNAGVSDVAFAPRAGVPLPPFRWDEERRAVARAELDARIAWLYGLTRDELRYILDPADVYGADFPGETFRVLKEKELKRYGEYRTRRLVLEAWERMDV
ncbi:MAG: SAM-dependent DNA methyltransferase [Chloroflexi bacterium AL-N10]|nr:SAM-dependent DNA methyltransferase [Chloroflexi bacterium AL-N1]NOK71097.1 SAM-dependent DNA methyltransferase [Chloroflexi bacterium AL-N10]NOK77345.1 SAM-dependent DNA methyltransferase [Chloroflexi bacterium AL-N5]